VQICPATGIAYKHICLGKRRKNKNYHIVIGSVPLSKPMSENCRQHMAPADVLGNFSRADFGILWD
jgi:hypothetical protein